MPKRKPRKIRLEEFRQLLDHQTQRKLEIFTHGGREVPTPASMPDKIILLGRHFAVRYHTKIYFERKASQRLNGCVMFESRVIFIDPENTLHAMRQTLFHEALHVYMKNAKIENLTHEQEEKLCDMIGWGIYDLLQNNSSLAVSCKE